MYILSISYSIFLLDEQYLYTFVSDIKYIFHQDACMSIYININYIHDLIMFCLEACYNLPILWYEAF